MSEAAPAENNTPKETGISKIFIGSLSFKTGKPSLTKAFTDLGVEVKNAKVVRNNTGRSMGYGFVEIPDKDVDLVISKLHHQELDGRQINVEKATSTKPKRKTKRVQRPKKTPTKGESGESQPAAPKEKTTKPAPVKKEKKPRRNNVNSTPREASETKLYVANIPFSLTDSELADVFAEYGKVEGKVIVNKKTQRSRGYGFVDVANVDLQKKAIAEKNKHDVGGRPITVRAAYRELPAPEPGTEAPAAAPEAAKPEPKADDKKEAPAKGSPVKKTKPKKKVQKKDDGNKEGENKKEGNKAAPKDKPAANKEETTKEAPKEEKAAETPSA